MFFELYKWYQIAQSITYVNGISEIVRNDFLSPNNQTDLADLVVGGINVIPHSATRCKETKDNLIDIFTYLIFSKGN